MLTKAVFKNKEAEAVCPEFPLHPQHSVICTEREGSESFVQPTQGGGKGTGVALVPQLPGAGSSHGAPPQLVSTREGLGWKISGEQRPHFPL